MRIVRVWQVNRGRKTTKEKDKMKTNMYVKMKSMLLAAIILSGSVVFAPTVSASDANEGTVGLQTTYGFCSQSIYPGGKLSYVVSSVFPIRDWRSAGQGVANSFRGFVDANYGNARGTSNCFTTIASYQDAENERNRTISNHRQNHDVIVVRWSYRE
jgi:hypothetical protein